MEKTSRRNAAKNATATVQGGRPFTTWLPEDAYRTMKAASGAESLKVGDWLAQLIRKHTRVKVTDRE